MEDNPLFTDYNFGGAALDILNSQLAYNTHYLGYYAHMLFNECFLDTAIKRASVVSRAKELNYTPKSIVAATAVVNINIIPTGTPIDISIPRGTTVAGDINGVNFTFKTAEDEIATPTGVGNVYQATDVTLLQGTRRDLAFVNNIAEATQRFILPFANIDTKHLEVTIQKEESDTENALWTFSDTILDINDESEVYFLQEAERGRFELIFGDDCLGKALEHGNVILVNYLITDGIEGNNAAVFTPVDDIAGTTNITYETVQPSVGGDDPEDIDFIRRQAPRFFESQKRAVTARDYETLLLNDIQFIRDSFDSVQVWGGEDNIPRRYGNVFVSLKPKPGAVITTFLKDQIKSELLDAHNVIGVIPIIVDPEFLFMELVVNVTYARNQTILTRDEIVQNVRDLLIEYRDNTLSLFDKTFRISEVACLIDDSDPSFISNLIDIKIKRKVELLFNQIENYKIDFRNALEPGTMSTTEFFIAETNQFDTDVYFMEDDRDGNIVLKKRALDNTTSIVNATFGTINYLTGVVDIFCFAPINLIGDDVFEVEFAPAIDDIFTIRNLIITFEDEDLTVTATGITV